jgi:hypothetical protein
MIPENRLKEFLVRAKRETFSSGKKPVEMDDGSRVYTFNESPLSYQDRYFGRAIDAGQEVVLLNGDPVWSMVYRGGLEAEVDRAACFTFLKTCLQNMPEDFPARGPLNLESGVWQYTNEVTGDFSNFKGDETILFNDRKVYFRNYCGGIVKK